MQKLKAPFLRVFGRSSEVIGLAWDNQTLTIRLIVPPSLLVYHVPIMSAAVSLLSTYTDKANWNPSLDDNGYRKALQDTSWADVFTYSPVSCSFR